MTIELDFISIAIRDKRRVTSRVCIEAPVRLEKPLSGFGSQVTVTGPEDFSMQVKGIHALQALEIALFVARTVLATNGARWTYEGEAGEPLDFSYEWPARQG